MMSWNEFEYSVADGMPLTLYEFSRGERLYYRYTNADKTISLLNANWLPIAISDNGLTQNTGDMLEITVPITNEVVALFRGVPPSDAVKCKIHRVHYHDPSIEVQTIWMGSVIEIKRQTHYSAQIISASIASTLNRNGLRLTWGKTCPHALYDSECNVRPDMFVSRDMIITNLDGAGITVNIPVDTPDNYFSGGYIEFSVNSIRERRGIKIQSGNVLTLFGGSPGLSVGVVISVYPGCDHTIATCQSKFSNALNYGGEPHLPGHSPYEIIKLF